MCSGLFEDWPVSTIPNVTLIHLFLSDIKIFVLKLFVMKLRLLLALLLASDSSF